MQLYVTMKHVYSCIPRTVENHNIYTDVCFRGPLFVALAGANESPTPFFVILHPKKRPPSELAFCYKWCRAFPVHYSNCFSASYSSFCLFVEQNHLEALLGSKYYKYFFSVEDSFRYAFHHPRHMCPPRNVTPFDIVIRHNEHLIVCIYFFCSALTGVFSHTHASYTVCLLSIYAFTKSVLRADKKNLHRCNHSDPFPSSMFCNSSFPYIYIYIFAKIVSLANIYYVHVAFFSFCCCPLSIAYVPIWQGV
eukprot:GEMP01013283.1.p1 GENE.GEMP01013283.1~~GEMP01013283.1.p1  ORF type:complete len:250 (+),score=-29.81 GEMP01013283.1:685-1434(+)